MEKDERHYLSWQCFNSSASKNNDHM